MVKMNYHKAMSDEKVREWTVKCLRHDFVPCGALLIGPEINTDDIVVLKSAYDQLMKDTRALRDECDKIINHPFSNYSQKKIDFEKVKDNFDKKYPQANEKE